LTGLAPFLWSLPWVAAPVLGTVRSVHSTSLDDESPTPPADAPLLSVIIPARDEARNIERCVRSVLATTYPGVEVIVVDDHSSDDTGLIARTIAASDPRVRVVSAPDLPDGWFGKQWACATGAAEARGSLLLFADADTRHAPDLLPRAVNALRRRVADLLTVAGFQEMHSFWERVLQPQVFAMLSLRYGGTEDVSHTRRPVNAIANGQFILVRRDAYDAMGGHALVRDHAAEDLAMAQEYVRAGRRLVMVLGIDQLSTHMYASLSEMITGWRKNMFAAGRYSALGGRAGRALYPLMLVGMPLVGLVPPIVFALSVAGLLSSAWLVWSAIIVTTAVIFWLGVYRFMRQPLWYALLYPLGLGLVLYIALAAVARGRRVRWKDREYVAR
jgi:chlorobactene glucosyltransferase